ncbi:MAG TPA: CPBP family glutamic-type intramembrane protease [Kofleriaceae bacterium]
MIARRWTLLTAGALAGLLAYIPVARANVDPPPAIGELALPVAIASVIAAIACWLGLRWADATGLPMPALRRIEGTAEASERRGLAIACAGAIAGGAAAVATLHAFELPNLGGSLAVRLASTAFAAITLEVVIHLFFLAAMVRLTRSRRIGIAVSTLVFVVFHAGGALGAPPAILVSVVVLNGALGTFFGWLAVRFGFEYAVLAHAIAHAIAVTLG